MEASNAEVSKMLAKMWREAPAPVKKQYTDAEAYEREQYKIRIAEWRVDNAKRKKAKTDHEHSDGQEDSVSRNEGDDAVSQSSTHFGSTNGQAPDRAGSAQPSAAGDMSRTRGGLSCGINSESASISSIPADVAARIGLGASGERYVPNVAAKADWEVLPRTLQIEAEALARQRQLASLQGIEALLGNPSLLLPQQGIDLYAGSRFLHAAGSLLPQRGKRYDCPAWAFCTLRVVADFDVVFFCSRLNCRPSAWQITSF